LYYSINSGQPGYVQVQTGDYVWEPAPGNAGTHLITIVAEENPYRSSSLTFQVNVLSGGPQVASLTAAPSSSNDAGADLLTLTADGVATTIGKVDKVEFYRDSNGDGQIDPTVDVYLGTDDHSTDGRSFKGSIGGVTPGKATFLTRAGRYSFFNLFWSDTAKVTIAVSPSPC
jgi:hypothetical protein